jgi:hypothetical protein
MYVQTIMGAAFTNTTLPRFSDGMRNSEHNNRRRIRANMEFLGFLP